MKFIPASLATLAATFAFAHGAMAQDNTKFSMSVVVGGKVISNARTQTIEQCQVAAHVIAMQEPTWGYRYASCIQDDGTTFIGKATTESSWSVTFTGFAWEKGSIDPKALEALRQANARLGL